MDAPAPAAERRDAPAAPGHRRLLPRQGVSEHESRQGERPNSHEELDEDRLKLFGPIVVAVCAIYTKWTDTDKYTTEREALEALAQTPQDDVSLDEAARGLDAQADALIANIKRTLPDSGDADEEKPGLIDFNEDDESDALVGRVLDMDEYGPGQRPLEVLGKLAETLKEEVWAQHEAEKRALALLGVAATEILVGIGGSDMLGDSSREKHPDWIRVYLEKYEEACNSFMGTKADPDKTTVRLADVVSTASTGADWENPFNDADGFNGLALRLAAAAVIQIQGSAESTGYFATPEWNEKTALGLLLRCAMALLLCKAAAALGQADAAGRAVARAARVYVLRVVFKIGFICRPGPRSRGAMALLRWKATRATHTHARRAAMVSAGGDQPNWAAVAARWHRLRPHVDAPLRGGLCTALLGPPEPHGPLDVRVEFRQFMVDHRGVPETGMPAWTLCQTISVADSEGVEASATVPAKDFAVVASDVHGGALRTMSLADLTRRARRVFVDNHLDSDSRLGIERVSARFRAALVPVHRNNSKWRTQVRYVVYDPTTQSADRPRRAHIVSSVAGCSLHTSRAAAVDGFTPLYSQLRREENGESVPRPHCYATDVSRLGAPEFVRPLATGPKGAVTVTDDASAWVVSIPIVPGRPEVFGTKAPGAPGAPGAPACASGGFDGFGCGRARPCRRRRTGTSSPIAARSGRRRRRASTSAGCCGRGASRSATTRRTRIRCRAGC